MTRYQYRAARLVTARVARAEMFAVVRDAEAVHGPSWITRALRVELALMARLVDRDAAWLRSQAPTPVAR